MKKLMNEMIDTLKKINEKSVLGKIFKNEEFAQQQELIEEYHLIEENLLNKLMELKQSNLKDKYLINNQLNEIYRIFGGIIESLDEVYELIRILDYKHCQKNSNE